jgi:hypothetical protein
MQQLQQTVSRPYNPTQPVSGWLFSVLKVVILTPPDDALRQGDDQRAEKAPT